MKLRPIDHWPSSCKYGSSNRKQQILQNSPWSCGVERLLDDESLARKYLTLSLKFLAEQMNRTIILEQNNPRDRTIILGQREYHSNKPRWPHKAQMTYVWLYACKSDTLSSTYQLGDQQRERHPIAPGWGGIKYLADLWMPRTHKYHLQHAIDTEGRCTLFRHNNNMDTKSWLLCS